MVDARTGRLLSSAPAGTAQGIAIDAKDGTLFIGDEDEKALVVLDRKTLKQVGLIPVTGLVDAVAFDPKTDTIYAGHDDGTEVWVIDGRTHTQVGSVAIGGAPEYMGYSPRTDRVYQRIMQHA